MWVVFNSTVKYCPHWAFSYAIYTIEPFRTEGFVSLFPIHCWLSALPVYYFILMQFNDGEKIKPG